MLASAAENLAAQIWPRMTAAAHNARQLTDLPPRGGGPSLSESGLEPLYCPGVGVLGRARFACQQETRL